MCFSDDTTAATFEPASGPSNGEDRESIALSALMQGNGTFAKAEALLGKSFRKSELAGLWDGFYEPEYASRDESQDYQRAFALGRALASMDPDELYT